MGLSFKLLFALSLIDYSVAGLSKLCKKANFSFTFVDVQSLHFSTVPRDVTFLNTRTTKIECQASGLPKPSVSWETIDGRPVRNISDIRHVNYDGSLEFLAFDAAKFNSAVHRTQYRCVAKSALGRLRSTAVRVKASK